MSSNNDSPSSLKPFFVKLCLFSFVAIAVVLFWKQYASLRFQTNLGWVLLLFFIAVTAITHIILLRAAEKSPQKFVMLFMTITGIRLFGYLTVILVYAVIMREAALGFTLLFLILYFLFSAFEVSTLLRHFKK